MGTNFYLKLNLPDDLTGRKQIHLGKRSAAGLWCWLDNVTLCKGGKAEIHMVHSGWHDECPICGQTKIDEPLSESTVGRELGFNKNPPKIKTGVVTCCSFTWAIGPEEVEQRMDKSNYRPIIDEYDRPYTLEEFQDVLRECPIRYYHAIGWEFS